MTFFVRTTPVVPGPEYPANMTFIVVTTPELRRLLESFVHRINSRLYLINNPNVYVPVSSIHDCLSGYGNGALAIVHSSEMERLAKDQGETFSIIREENRFQFNTYKLESINDLKRILEKEPFSYLNESEREKIISESGLPRSPRCKL